MTHNAKLSCGIYKKFPTRPVSVDIDVHNSLKHLKLLKNNLLLNYLSL